MSIMGMYELLAAGGVYLLPSPDLFRQLRQVRGSGRVCVCACTVCVLRRGRDVCWAWADMGWRVQVGTVRVTEGVWESCVSRWDVLDGRHICAVHAAAAPRYLYLYGRPLHHPPCHPCAEAPLRHRLCAAAVALGCAAARRQPPQLDPLCGVVPPGL